MLIIFISCTSINVTCSFFIEQPAISDIASISEKDTVGRFFLDAIRKLLDATKAVNAEQKNDSSMQIEANSNTNNMARSAQNLYSCYFLFMSRFQLKPIVNFNP